MGLAIVMKSKPDARDRAPSREAPKKKVRRRLRKRVSPSQQLVQPDKPEEQVVGLGFAGARQSPKRGQDNPGVDAPDAVPHIVPAPSQPKNVAALVILVKKD